MTTASHVTENEKVSIMDALRKALPDDPNLSIDERRVLVRGDERHVYVVPYVYPEHKWNFLSRLAEAEMVLRDAGMKVRLEPAYAQRMLVIATTRGRRPFAYLTTDGNEYRDRAEILGLSDHDPSWATVEGYLYDTGDDLRQVIEEARREHPDADLSRVQDASSSTVD